MTLNADGSFTYTPDPGFNGTDRFTYTVTDDDGAVSNIATVTFTVNDVNDPPVATDNDYTTDEDTAVAGMWSRMTPVTVSTRFRWDA